MSKFGICRFCGCENDLVESHIIPKFVFNHQKRTSATGFLRTNQPINIRTQDGLKLHWLCGDCEKRFNKWETLFANHIYYPLNHKEQKPFKYGSWLLKFATSVSWRSLSWYIDVARLQKEYTEEKLLLVDKALTTWKEFILDFRPHPGPFQQHMIFFDSIDRFSGSLDLPPNMNRFMTRGTHINLGLSEGRPIFIYTKMGKITLLGFIDIAYPRQWVDTQIHVKHGTIGGNVTLPMQFFNYLKERAKVVDLGYNEISIRQQEAVSKSLEKGFDKVASSESFQMLDRDVDMFGIDAVFHKERDKKTDE